MAMITIIKGSKIFTPDKLPAGQRFCLQYLIGPAFEFISKTPHGDRRNEQQQNPRRHFKEFIQSGIPIIKYTGCRKYKEE